MGSEEKIRIPQGTCFLSIKKQGIEWFDEILEKDDVLNSCVSTFDLAGITKRMNELREKHNVTLVKSVLD